MEFLPQLYQVGQRPCATVYPLLGPAPVFSIPLHPQFSPFVLAQSLPQYGPVLAAEFRRRPAAPSGPGRLCLTYQIETVPLVFQLEIEFFWDGNTVTIPDIARQAEHLARSIAVQWACATN